MVSKNSKNTLYSFKSELIFVPSENALAFEIKCSVLNKLTQFI